MNKKFIDIFFSEDTFLSVLIKRKDQKVKKELKKDVFSPFLKIKQEKTLYFLTVFNFSAHYVLQNETSS